MACKEYKYELCKRLFGICEYLDYAHGLPEHDEMEKTKEYQRVIGASEELNDISLALGLRCQCIETPLGASKHKGHRFLTGRKGR